MKSNIQGIFRAAVCLVLVCCLTVNISPIKAKAAVDPATAIAFDFAARSVVASAMQGLGVSKGSDPTVFDGIVNSAVDALSTPTNFILDGLARVAKFNLTPGVASFFLPLAVVQSLWDWLCCDGGVVSSSDGFATSITCSYPGFTGIFEAEHPFAVGYYTRYGNPTFFVYSSYSQRVYTTSDVGSEGSYYLNSGPYGGYYVDSASNGSWTTSEFSGVPYLGEITPACTSSSTLIQLKYVLENLVGGVTTPTTDYDLTLGEVGTPYQSVEEAQPAWAENIVSVPGSVYGSDDDYVPSVPIAVAPDYEGTTNISQSDVQAGNSTWVDTETDTDIGTDTLPDALAGTVATTIAWHFISGLFDVFVPGFELISNAIEGIGALLKALPQTLKDVFGIDALLEKIGAIYETVVQCFLDTITGIRSIPQAIADVLAAIFVPSTDYITAKVEAIRAKFPFMDSIISTGEYIRDSLSGSSGPPAIYVDLTLADGDIDYGEKTLLTDFSWYAPYKGTVDSVLGAALWAFFGWRVFLRLPGLISGADGYVGEIRTLSSRSSGAGGRKKED